MPITVIGSMGSMRKSTPFADAIADNVRRLMAQHGLSQLALAEKAKVGQATLSGLLSEEADAPRRNPRADTIDRLADYFGVPGWVLGIPGVPLDLLAGPEIKAVMMNLVSATATGRQTILRVAEHEGHYAALQDIKP